MIAEYDPHGDIQAAINAIRAEEDASRKIGRLDGSPRQVAWAGHIRRQYLQTGGRDAITSAQRSAKWWIDNRHNLV